jgi:pimeloyl-ACP methyl ester carboxylesterase
VPTSADDWTPFLALGGGIAPGLPGFGRSGKRAAGAYTMEGYDRWLEAFLDHLQVERFRLLVHDWGAVGPPGCAV